MHRIYLPGTSEQLRLLLENLDLNEKSILVIGANSELLAKRLYEQSKTKIELIVEDYESLINAELLIERSEGTVAAKMMAFENTDYLDSTFDLVYAQASVSSKMRNKIVKEIKRVLKPDGYFCVGEIVQLTDNTPTFVKNIWEDSALSPLHTDKIKSYYEERNFDVIYEEDLSKTLNSFYSMTAGLLKDQINKLSEEEKSFNKKLLNRISHESNVYLKQGGNKYIGFKTLLLKKK
ncbi:MAG: class I SAM-dependent methyltransferase [Bacteroidota bacterium]|nr:class I SAM-dependent methyltransferase [Bacteroidota bacterium]MDP4190712.1 class I SAM-dependent methyltransferase [Bacteroidota bacterium]MDP4195877.1 class I SAM-dependent methyltransferase [Bacteroidota bacterium]